MTKKIDKYLVSLKRQISIIIENFLNENSKIFTIIAYHGTTDKGYGSYKYIYYTTDYDYAKKFAESNGRVEKVKIKYSNPFIINAKYMGYGEIILNNKIIGFYRDLNSETVEELINSGYDIIIVNYPEKNKDAFEIIPFKKEQVTIIDTNV